MSERIRIFWRDWSVYVMAFLFVVTFYWMISRQYATFDFRSSDLDRFIQGLWNTFNGRFMYSTIEARSIIGGHFTPLFVILSPLLQIWPDPRVLGLVQTLGLATAGIIFYLIVRPAHPMLAPLFALAFYLNPSLHQIGILELRRITLAIPFLALAFYGLATQQRRWLLIGVVCALLAKENVAVPVFFMGFYILAIERDWKWGLGIMGLAVAWVLLVFFVTNPYFDPKVKGSENKINAYRGIFYFGQFGSSPVEIAQSLIRKPQVALFRMFDEEARIGLMRLFLPVGFVLPLLAPAAAAVALPSLGYMLLSSQSSMHSLDLWYVGELIPILFGAMALGLSKRSTNQARWFIILLLGFTVLGYSQYSQALYGGRYNPIRYEITTHHQKAAEMAAAIPPEASVMTQSAYTPHLAQREFLYLHPWEPERMAALDYILLDRQLKSYPFNEIERNDAINNLIADPEIVIEKEVGGIFLFRPGGPQLPAFTVDKVADGAIRLDRVEISPADEQGYYWPTVEQPVSLRPGQTIRVTLYWEAVAAPEAERTVSVRITADDGYLIAQQDTKPSNGARPTSWWQPGWKIRDVYYLTIPPDTPPQNLSLDVLLYDSYTQERLPFGELDTLSIAPLLVE
ncbi:MAG: DUF2079 domain-containing protein [Chloroflexi bacterium]|nr:DUF2079 domain-containing protein [Chloroflexota bacterium]